MDSTSSKHRTLKWAIATLAALFTAVVIVILVITLIDANYLRGPLTRYIAARTGRYVRIDGNLKAHLLSFTPRLVGERVAIGNPPWMPPGPTAEIGTLSLSFELLPLFTHSFVISRLEMHGAVLHLARESDGRANWQAHAPGTKAGKGPPLIHSLSMPSAHVELEDARRHLHFDGTVSIHDSQGAVGVSPLQIDGAGQLNTKPVTFTINGDALASVSHERPYHFAFVENSSGSRLSATGSLPQPFDFHFVDATFDAEGADLKDMYFLAGITLPDTGAYRLSGKLARRGMHFLYSDLLATSGQSDMRGTLSIEISGERPKLDADLHSQLLRMADLGARAAGRMSESEAAKLPVLPDTPYTARWHPPR